MVEMMVGVMTGVRPHQGISVVVVEMTISFCCFTAVGIWYGIQRAIRLIRPIPIRTYMVMRKARNKIMNCGEVTSTTILGRYQIGEIKNRLAIMARQYAPTQIIQVI